MIDPDRPQALLGGLSPARFMRRHWQRRPLLVRGALSDPAPPLPRAALFAMVARDDVESRLVTRDGDRWTLRRGPLARRSLPPVARPGWTLLLQGLDLHLDAAHALLARFRFLPEVRLDDLMLSYASDGGGVGPHTDSYDVFLLQVAGRRRWTWAPCPRPRLRDDVPLKMLERMPRGESAVLEPGDMLYLPPGWAHDGVAVGPDCMTASAGFRAPTRAELARALLERLADEQDTGDDDGAPRYADAGAAPTLQPGAIPAAMLGFARDALARKLARPGAVERALGCWLTEPKPSVWFDGDEHARLVLGQGVVLDRRTRIAYDRRHLFVNGESFSAAGRDATLVRRLADRRRLAARDVQGLAPEARALLAEWLQAGWLHLAPPREMPHD